MTKPYLGKRVPRFWWDFKWKDGQIASIDVESDDDEYPIIAVFAPVPIDATAVLSGKVWPMLDDLQAGRADYRRLAKETRNKQTEDKAK